MLEKSDAARLDLALTDLAALIDAAADPAEVMKLVRQLIDDNTDDGLPGAHARKLVRRSWEQTWIDCRFLASGWFYDPNFGVLDKRSGEALHEVFVVMVKLLHVASDQRRRALIGEARGLIVEYLAIRSAVPQP